MAPTINWIFNGDVIICFLNLPPPKRNINSKNNSYIMSSNDNSIDSNHVEIEDGCWDFYSGLPNPKFYDKTFSDSIEDED